MPRVVEITVPADITDAVTSQLSDRDDVLSLRVLRDVSLQPPGDVVVAEVLNTGLADVMRLADDIGLARTRPSRCRRASRRASCRQRHAIGSCVTGPPVRGKKSS